MAQWLRIHLLMQETWVRPLAQEDPTRHRTVKPRTPQLLSTQAVESMLHGTENPTRSEQDSVQPEILFFKGCLKNKVEISKYWNAHILKADYSNLKSRFMSPCTLAKYTTHFPQGLEIKRWGGIRMKDVNVYE